MRRFKMLVFSEPFPGREAEFEAWYTGRHLDDICALPGFTTAPRSKLHSVSRATTLTRNVALYDVERAPTGGAAVTVEYVFANEKELQRLHLEPSRGGGWRITAADASRREKSLIPYGTPIEQVE